MVDNTSKATTKAKCFPGRAKLIKCLILWDVVEYTKIKGRGYIATKNKEGRKVGDFELKEGERFAVIAQGGFYCGQCKAEIINDGYTDGCETCKDLQKVGNLINGEDKQ